MTKKQLFLLAGALALIIIMVWGIFYAWNRRIAKEVSSVGAGATGGTPITNSNGKTPPTLPSVPVSATKGIESYTGALILTAANAELKTAAQTYALVTSPASNFAATLGGKGFVNGDKVAVMGHVVAGQIIVSGLNKLVK